ncbi:cytochrome ubiquinol oxidase subunit I [Sulfoacidibacillus thermotolerans]|uniref:Cytochrome ubiquinol oxidase subunit I n=1 Tax=Sulfoacidibacillus thermotolerans TaxID=1765684 RepID=A0A2U3D9X0_SULT2|nr:cytochrome ubiquinol oxidase subunit I [Sulfoacidibacillus thermotolerans]PWI58078.1 cytochrome ubiquinol oxidase subunit I [Sulfoacidibacillus thermotolerans]
METIWLDRWQFGITTVYHFFFVPLTIGLAFLISIMETLYVVKKDTMYRRMAQFWAKLFLINFATGVITGIMQEFQFGMNWASYSRFVGDIFGPPLAIEALAAFFLESAFVGAWLFGWDKLPPKVHLFTIWMVTVGTSLSAFWILAANSFMQEPVGYVLAHGRAEMRSFGAVIVNPQLRLEFPHVWLGAITTGAFFVAGVSAYYLLRKREVALFAQSFRLSIFTAVISSVLVLVVGHAQAQHLMKAQPMKMAAAEALWHTSPYHAPWTLVAWIDSKHHSDPFTIKIPYVLSILSYNHTYGKVPGIDELQAKYQKQYGPGNYVPSVWVEFWTFRIMVFAGTIMIFLPLYGTFYGLRRDELFVTRRTYLRWMPWAISLPYLANTTGWIMTEMGRQPWVVYGLLKTNHGISPTVGSPLIWMSILGFGAIYTVFAVIDVFLFVKFIRKGPDPEFASDEMDAKSVRPLFES